MLKPQKHNCTFSLMMMILMMTKMMCLKPVLMRVSPFFRSSSRPQNRAAAVDRSTPTTRMMAAMALRYSYALHDSRIKKRQRQRQLWRSIFRKWLSFFLSFHRACLLSLRVKLKTTFKATPHRAAAFFFCSLSAHENSLKLKCSAYSTPSSSS